MRVGELEIGKMKPFERSLVASANGVSKPDKVGLLGPLRTMI
jgi:hypothetical protein